MMKKYDSNLKLESLTPIHDGMSTSNYVIRANGKKYLLKIYTDSPNGPDHIEHTMYNYLYRNIPVPSLMYFGQTKTADIPALLALINTECPPEEWIMDIVQDINTYFSKYLA